MDESAEDHKRRCMACGAAITPDDKFCRGCGLRLP